MVKKFVFYFVLLLVVASCGEEKTNHEQFNKTKSITARILDLNKSLEDIRKIEKGKMTDEKVDFLEYEYSIGEGDSYVVSYLFDQKGCYEIGIDGYFATQQNASLMLNDFKTEISKTYGPAEDANELSRWLTPDEAITIELDFANTNKGLAVVTIFANQ